LYRLRGAGAAAGIVAAQAHYPVRLLRQYADGLQKKAKQAGAKSALRSTVAWTLLTDSSPLPEGPDAAGEEGDSVVADARLASFETLLAEAAAAERAGVPGAALHRLVGQAREEDAGLRSLAPGQGREEVLALLAANFFRYQLARNRELAAWWQEIAPADPPDPVSAWFRASGVRRIERLVELLSLEPIPEVVP
jgi:hypothetical protein